MFNPNLAVLWVLSANNHRFIGRIWKQPLQQAKGFRVHGFVPHNHVARSTFLAQSINGALHGCNEISAFCTEERRQPRLNIAGLHGERNEQECHLGPLRICDINRKNYVPKGAAFQPARINFHVFNFPKWFCCLHRHLHLSTINCQIQIHHD